jgi:8-oxo-dGTP pyrophosphatase MutT (NUDIX family)
MLAWILPKRGCRAKQGAVATGGDAMDGFLVHEVAAEPVVRVGRPMPALPPEVDELVERLWREACARAEAGGAGRLFNGSVFSVDRFTPHEITGHMTEFRRVVAQMHDPAMFAALGLRQFAVCGVLLCRDGLLVGRRHGDAVYQPGLWQLPPAGSVDSSALRADGRIDIEAALLAELTEELGLAADTVDAPRPLCVVEHPGSHVCDLGLALRTRLDGEAVLAAHRAAGNSEYDPLLVVPQADLPGFVAEAGAGIVPPAIEFMKRLGLLPA